MKKNILCFWLTLCMIMATPFAVSAEMDGTCGNSIKWTLDDNGTLIISGSGAMDNWSYKTIESIPWYSLRESINKVILSDGITHIGDYAFDNCINLTSVIISNDVTYIGDSAFFNCSSLTNASLPSDVTYIGVSAFSNCRSLTHISIPYGVNIINVSTFSNCTGLKVVTIPDSVTKIDNYAFSHCESLINISIPKSVTEIGHQAFRFCYKLVSISVPKSVSIIGTRAFQECRKLMSVVISNSKITIFNYAFDDCPSLGVIYGYAGTRTEQVANALGVEFVDLGGNNRKPSQKVPVGTVMIGIENIEMKVGDTKKLTVTCYPFDATDKRVTWSSSNQSVATVDSNGYVTCINAGSAIIIAKSTNGKTASCNIKAYAQNVINYTNYKYGFGNSSDSFGYSWLYKIPKERYMQVGLSESLAKANVKANGRWSGNCFGMSVSSILFYKNVLQEERYNDTVHVPIDFANPDAGDGAFMGDKWEVKLRHMIELFQVSQYVEGQNCWKGYIFDKSIETTKEIVQIIKNEIDLGNPVQLGLDGYKKSNGEDVGHSIVIYGYDDTSIGTKFYLYDCSGFVDTALYDGGVGFAFHYIDDEYVWMPENIVPYRFMFDMYRYLYNANSNDAASLFSLSQEPTYTYLFRSAEDLTITNSAGLASTIVDGELSGEIEDMRLVPSSYLAENPMYTIILPTDTYTIVGESDEIVTTSVADDYMSAEVTAKSSTPVTISADLRKIDVDTVMGDEYRVQYTTFDNIFDEMTLTGSALGTVSTSLSDTEIEVKGVETLAAEASVSDTTVSTSSENLADCGAVTVKCEDTENGASLQVLSDNAELTEKAALPERLQVESPAYDLESGEYTEGQVLTFTKDDETVVYYTTDGSIPSADNGIIYSLPIEINKSMTIKAISTKFGYTDSEIVELNYNLPEIDMPLASVESGEYDNVISVSLSTDDFSDQIYYTIDGSDPFENGILYTVPINISEDTVLRAYTLKNGCVSEVCEYNYSVTSAYPFYFSNSLTNQDGEVITADNISQLTKIKAMVSKLHEGDQVSTFLVAFYDADDRLICVKSQPETICEDVQIVDIDIIEDVSSACSIKVLAWGDLEEMSPVCEVHEEVILVE